MKMDTRVLKKENSCRVCLSEDTWNLVELFNLQNHAQKLVSIAGVQIHEGDKLPQKICSECLQKVEAACEIKEKCIETDQLLRGYLKPDDIECDRYLEVEFNGAVSIKTEPHTEWLDNYESQDPNESIAKPEPEQSDDDENWPELPSDDQLPRASVSKAKGTSKPKLLGLKPKPRKPQPRPEDFKCLFCMQIFPKIMDKTKHMKAEHADELICRICNKKRSSVTATENCMKDHVHGHKFLCQLCAQPFRKKGHLDEHIKGVHAEKSAAETPTCDLCGTKLKYKPNMRRHMRTVHMDQKIPCPHTDMCPDVFYTTVNSLNNHLYRVHNLAAPINCEKCHAGFTNLSELRGHLKRNCTGNPLKVKRKQYVTLRQFYDEREGLFHCNLCPKVMVTKKYYSDHFQNYHRDNKTCAICNRTFASFVSYRRHKKSVHDKIRDFFCDYPGCGKAFSMKSGQLAHKKTHLKS